MLSVLFTANKLQPVLGFVSASSELVSRPPLVICESSLRLNGLIVFIGSAVGTIKAFSLNDDSQITKGGLETNSDDADTKPSTGCSLFAVNNTDNIDLGILSLLVFLILFKSKLD
jgi:hypothetical protein